MIMDHSIRLLARRLNAHSETASLRTLSLVEGRMKDLSNSIKKAEKDKKKRMEHLADADLYFEAVLTSLNRLGKTYDLPSWSNSGLGRKF